MAFPVIKIHFSFQIALPDYPVSCRIANPVLFGNVLPDGTLLVFGGYDLIFCCSIRDKKQENLFRTVIVPRTLTENVLPEKTGLAGKERLEIELEQPLIAQVRPGKPSRAGIWELLAGILRDRVWVEVVVEGEITVKLEGLPFQDDVEARQANRIDDTGAGGIREREAPEAPAGNPAGKSTIREQEPGSVRISDKIALDLDSLAYLVNRIIQQREKEMPPCGPARNQADYPCEKHGDQPPAGRNEEEICSDILRRIVVRGEKEQGQQRGGTVTNQEFAGYDLSSIPLEKIPSRPGLQQTFVQQMPPPKPPEHGG